MIGALLDSMAWLNTADVSLICACVICAGIVGIVLIDVFILEAARGDPTPENPMWAESGRLSAHSDSVLRLIDGYDPREHAAIRAHVERRRLHAIASVERGPHLKVVAILPYARKRP